MIKLIQWLIKSRKVKFDFSGLFDSLATDEE